MKLTNHFEKHGGEFGAKTPEHYQSMAQNFLMKEKGEGILEKVRANGDVIKYNPSTNEFGVMSKDGVIRTYYKPNPDVHGMGSNLEYFNAQ